MREKEKLPDYVNLAIILLSETIIVEVEVDSCSHYYTAPLCIYFFTVPKSHVKKKMKESEIRGRITIQLKRKARILRKYPIT